jgi:hypothetical protein
VTVILGDDPVELIRSTGTIPPQWWGAGKSVDELGFKVKKSVRVYIVPKIMEELGVEENTLKGPCPKVTTISRCNRFPLMVVSARTVTVLSPTTSVSSATTPVGAVPSGAEVFVQ